MHVTDREAVDALTAYIDDNERDWVVRGAVVPLKAYLQAYRVRLPGSALFPVRKA